MTLANDDSDALIRAAIDELSADEARKSEPCLCADTAQGHPEGTSAGRSASG